jgi:hypothetical protein
MFNFNPSRSTSPSDGGDTAQVVVVSDLQGPTSSYAAPTLFNSYSDFTRGASGLESNGIYRIPESDLETEISVEFFTDAPGIEFRISRSSSAMIILVDGVRVHEVFIDEGYDQRIYSLVFEDSRRRRVRLQGTSIGFGGIYVGGSGVSHIWPVSERESLPLLAVVTDSYGNGIGTHYGSGFNRYLAAALGVDLWTDARNSHGWTSGNSPADRVGNLAELIVVPDYILACMGYNDKGATSAAVITGLNDWHAAVSALFPGVPRAITGPWTPGGEDADLVSLNNTLSVRAGQLGIPFIDISSVLTEENEGAYVLPGDIHPTLAGADYLGARIKELGLAKGFFD